MQFVTEWQPLKMNNIRFDDVRRVGATERYEFRHCLALAGATLLVLAPIVGIFFDDWLPILFVGSIGLLAVSVAAIIVPDLSVEMSEYESFQDRRGT